MFETFKENLVKTEDEKKRFDIYLSNLNLLSSDFLQTSYTLKYKKIKQLKRSDRYKNKESHVQGALN